MEVVEKLHVLKFNLVDRSEEFPDNFRILTLRFHSCQETASAQQKYIFSFSKSTLALFHHQGLEVEAAASVFRSETTQSSAHKLGYAAD